MFNGSALLGNTSFTDDIRKMKSRRAGKRAQREATTCPREWTSKELERQKGMVTRPGPKKKDPLLLGKAKHTRRQPKEVAQWNRENGEAAGLQGIVTAKGFQENELRGGWHDVRGERAPGVERELRLRGNKKLLVEWGKGSTLGRSQRWTDLRD